MARPVDAEALEKKISEWLGQPGNGDYYSGYDAALCAVQDLIADTPTITPPNEPLTLEQLRKMDGQPVYIIASDMGIAEWNVIAGKEWITVAYDVPCNGFKAVVEGVGFINGRAFRIDSYGKDWFAYRRPSEGET